MSGIFTAKEAVNISFEQLSLFHEELEVHSNEASRKKNAATVSNRLLDAFEVSNIPFLGCDFHAVYPALDKNIPSEKVVFKFPTDSINIACEIICAAICHQMNWDYLRRVVREKTAKSPNWLNPENLSEISCDIIASMLKDYHKPERIRCYERTLILRDIGKVALTCGGFEGIFFGKDGEILSQAQISQTLSRCRAFSQDPEEKKLQLLFQKLSHYPQLTGLASLCKPAVDYHIIRCYLRRGLLSPKTKLSTDYVFSSNIPRRESTVGALRQLCGQLILEISNYTNLSVNSVNQVEWYVGRSICTEGLPDCSLNGTASLWAKEKYDVCPFSATCCALNYNHNLFHIEEPTYLGTSY